MSKFQNNCFTAKLYQKLASLLEENCSAFALVTLIEKKGSGPQQVGAKMLISENSSIPLLGTVGGGALEAHAIKIVAEHFQQQTNPASSTDEQQAESQQKPISVQVKLNLQKDLKMNCGGEVKLFFEFFYPVNIWNIVVFGAGHISQSLIPLLCQLNANIYCIDDRAQWLDKLSEAPNLSKLLINNWKKSILQVPESSFFVCLTRSHKIDFKITKALYSKKGNTQPRYVGVVGSAIKAKKLFAHLEKEGNSREELLTLHCPIGLIDTNTDPFEIAISICCQLLDIRKKCL